jgi:hypothetical protein
MARRSSKRAGYLMTTLGLAGIAIVAAWWYRDFIESFMTGR